MKILSPRQGNSEATKQTIVIAQRDKEWCLCCLHYLWLLLLDVLLLLLHVKSAFDILPARQA
jgi:hypothetical protein